MESRRDCILEYIQRSIQIKSDMIDVTLDLIDRIVEEVVAAYRRGNKVVWFGNGGSAADAQHLACELVGKFNLERKALCSLALTTNTSVLTAIANDYHFDQVFARQVEALVNPKDIVIGISTSGNARSVIKGLEEAKRRQAITIGFTGSSGGKMRGNKSIDYLLHVPSDVTSHIQECHITIGHIICHCVEKTLFEK